MRNRTRRWRQAGTGAPGRRPEQSAPPSVAEVGQAVVAAATYHQRGRPDLAEASIRRLAACWTPGAVPPPAAHAVPVAARTRLEDAVAVAWQHGWQPADLHRVTGRRLGPQHTRLLTDTIAAQALSYRGAPHSDGHWLRQLGSIEAEPWWPPGAEQLDCWARREDLDSAGALRCAVELLGALWGLPRLPRLCPPPAEWGTPPPGASRRPAAAGACAATAPGADAKILDRIRALLAKAESTEYPAEAEALSAKAQQMMTRHAIDHAMLAPAEQGDPVGRRLGVADPYAGAKAMLLDQVATASRCRNVWSAELGFSTVFGFPSDLDGVELLYTSLLVQASSAMLAAGKAGPGCRTRPFRQAFLTGFATRIGQRLAESARQTVGEARAEHGDALLPVLAARSRAVDQAATETFPQLRTRTVTIRDRAGWAAGTAAADLASLARGRPVAGSRSA